MTPAEVDGLVAEVARLRIWLRAAELEASALAMENGDLRTEILSLYDMLPVSAFRDSGRFRRQGRDES